MSLRDYQLKAIDQIREEFMRGHKKVLLVMPTGSGKTVVFCKMVKDGIAKGKKPGIIVRGRKLVDQASKRLFREGVDHGVLMANHWNFKPSKTAQACSIDTLIARSIDLNRFDFMVVDEAHLFSPESKAGKKIKDYRGYVVAVTATPYVDGGMRHLSDVMLRPIGMQDLIDQGHLVGFRIFAPSEPDLDGVQIQNKDYKNDQLEERMVAGQLTGKIIDHWIKIAIDRPTICFAVNIHHSKLLVDKFKEAGINAEHCDADTSDKERENIIKRLENGTTKIICNVGILCTGVDIPSLGAIILARPTKSYNLYIQQCGRGTRTYEGKSDCILLDHAGNVRRHGFPTLEPEVDLDGQIKKTSTPLESKVCKDCFAVYRGKACPSCGKIEVENKKEIIESSEELKELKISSDPIRQWLDHLILQRKKTGRKYGWEFWKLLEKYKFEEAEYLLPEFFKQRYKSKNAFDESNPFAESPFRGYRK